jgi:hypothetical protein
MFVANLKEGQLALNLAILSSYQDNRAYWVHNSCKTRANLVQRSVHVRCKKDSRHRIFGEGLIVLGEIELTLSKQLKMGCRP